jgi:hypothetical protein
VDVAAQDQLDIVGMSQENEKPVPSPKLDNVFVLNALRIDISEDTCN